VVITDKLLFETILPYMFGIVGLPQSPEYIREYVTQDEWYSTQSWTAEQEENFIKWLQELFRKRFRISKLLAYRRAAEFNLGYGWKTE